MSQRIVTHIYFQQRQFVQTMWDQAEVIAVDDKLSEGEERAWAKKKQTKSFDLLLQSQILLTQNKMKQTSDKIHPHPCTLAVASACCGTVPA